MKLRAAPEGLLVWDEADGRWVALHAAAERHGRGEPVPPDVVTFLAGGDELRARTRPVAVRQSPIADAATTSQPIELANVLDFTTGPNGLLRTSSACTSRALQSLSTNQPPTAAAASAGVASAIGCASTHASSSSKSRWDVWLGHHIGSPSASVAAWLAM